MKKLFIGCGIIVLVALGLLGYFGYQVWPDLMALKDANERFVQRLDDLDQQHAFDPDEPGPFDPERFAAVLDLRVDFRREFQERLGELERLEQQEEKPGLLETVSASFQALREISETVPTYLEATGMGPTEFEYHVRLLWATLESVGAGLGGDELTPLRTRYADLREAMPGLRRDFKQLKPLDEIVGTFDTAVVATARDILSTDPPRVEEGIAQPFVEVVVYMGLSSLRVEDLVAASEATEAEAEPAEPPPK